MCRSTGLILTVLTMTILLSTGLSAQNLLVNPDFDSDLVDWEGPGVWDPADAFGSPSSGSATWINDYAAGGSTIVRQCVDLASGVEGFDFAAHVFIPSGQPGEGYTYLTVAFYSDTVCDTFLTAVGSSNFSGFDNWGPLGFTDWTPDGAGSARISVANQKTEPGDFQTFCDAIFFGPNPEMLFADGFETMDASEWGSVAGGAV